MSAVRRSRRETLCFEDTELVAQVLVKRGARVAVVLMGDRETGCSRVGGYHKACASDGNAPSGTDSAREWRFRLDCIEL